MLISLRDEYESFPLKHRITYEEFDQAIKSVLKDIKNYVVKGHRVMTPIGHFMVKQRKRSMHRPSPNRLLSNKRRQEIIDSGGTPYKAIKDENGKIIGDNGGEKYFVYYTEDSFFYITTGHSRYITKGDNNYKFKPAESTRKAVAREIRDNKLIKISYAEN